MIRVPGGVGGWRCVTSPYPLNRSADMQKIKQSNGFNDIAMALFETPKYLSRKLFTPIVCI